MRGLERNSQELAGSSSSDLLILILDSSFAIVLSWNVVNSRGVECQELLNISSKALIPQGFILLEHVSLRTLDKFDLTVPQIPDIDSFIFC